MNRLIVNGRSYTPTVTLYRDTSQPIHPYFFDRSTTEHRVDLMEMGFIGIAFLKSLGDQLGLYEIGFVTFCAGEYIYRKLRGT